MDLDKAWNGLKNSTKNAISSANNSNTGSRQELKQKKKEEKNKLSEEASRELINAWKNQEWGKAENIAGQLGYNNKEYTKLLNMFIDFKETKGEDRVAKIEENLEKCEKFLEKAIKFRNKGNWDIVEPSIKKAANIYNQIEKDELLEAQREISQAENAIKHYNSQISNKEKAKDKEIHHEINEIDKSIKQAQEYIKDILKALKNRK